MLRIGIDKTDKNFRKFEYDDERMYGNPKMFKVLYEETGAFGEVVCSNVISVRKSTNTHNHFLDIPLNKKDEEPKSNQTSAKETSVSATKSLDTPEEKKKPKTTKTKAKTKSEPLTGKGIKVDIPTLELSPTYYKSYEYDVLTIDNISYIDDIKSKLNECGKDGWEVCGFQTVQKVFGCQAIIIMKKGLN